MLDKDLPNVMMTMKITMRMTMTMTMTMTDHNDDNDDNDEDVDDDDQLRSRKSWKHATARPPLAGSDCMLAWLSMTRRSPKPY